MIEAFNAYRVKSAPATPRRRRGAGELTAAKFAELVKRRGRSAQREFDASKKAEQERARRAGRRGESYGDPFFLGMVAMAREILIDLASVRIGRGE